MIKRVVILTRYFIPYNPAPGAVIRVLKLAEYFRLQGVTAEIVSGRGKEYGSFGYDAALQQMQVTYIGDEPTAPDGAARIAPGRSRLTGIRRLFRYLAFSARTFFHISRRLQAERFNNLFVSSPPHEIQLLALLLKLRFGSRVNWIVDYRDSWNLRKLSVLDNPGIAARLSLWLEKLILSRCDFFVFISNPMATKVTAHLTDVSSKGVLVMNGFDAEMIAPRAAPQATETLTIGYFGTFSDREESRKNPKPFLRALSSHKNDFQVVFYGEGELDSQWTKEFGDRLELKPMVPHNDAVMLMRQMTVLLVLSTEGAGGEEVITGKLFDYLLAERPILLVGGTESEAARIITSEGVGYVADFRQPEQIARVLERIYEDWRCGALPTYDIDRLMHLSRQQQYAKLLELLV